MRELSRRAGLSSGAVQLVMAGQRNAGPDFCRGLAQALGVPDEEVFRKAGLLKAIDHPEDHTLKQIYEAAQLLTVEQRVTALKIILGLKS